MAAVGTTGNPSHSVMSSAGGMGVNRMTDSNSHLHQQQQQQQYNNDVHDPFQQQQHHHQQQQQQQQTGGKPAGTITGMLADFSRALGTHSKECFFFSTSPFSFVYNETALLLWCAWVGSYGFYGVVTSELLFSLLGLGSNAARSSPSDQAFGTDPNQAHLQQHAKLNAPQNQQQQQLQMQQQLQQQLLQQQLQPQQQQLQQQNVYFAPDGSTTTLMANQSLNPFTGQPQQQPGQQITLQSLQQQQQTLPGQHQLPTSNYTAVFPNNPLSQIDPQQQLTLQQQQLQLQQQQQLGQAVSNNQILVNENVGPFQTNAQLQQKQLTQMNAITNQQQQQQPYGIPGTANYVQQVAQVSWCLNVCNFDKFLFEHLNS